MQNYTSLVLDAVEINFALHNKNYKFHQNSRWKLDSISPIISANSFCKICNKPAQKQFIHNNPQTLNNSQILNNFNAVFGKNTLYKYKEFAKIKLLVQKTLKWEFYSAKCTWESL